MAYLKGSNVVGAFDAMSRDWTSETICEILKEAGAKGFRASVRLGAKQLTINNAIIVTNFSMPPGEYSQLSEDTGR